MNGSSIVNSSSKQRQNHPRRQRSTEVVMNKRGRMRREQLFVYEGFRRYDYCTKDAS